MRYEALGLKKTVDEMDGLWTDVVFQDVQQGVLK